MTAAPKKTGGGAPRKVVGVCAVCRVDVHDAIRHYSSRSHHAKAAAWERARAPKQKD